MSAATTSPRENVIVTFLAVLVLSGVVGGVALGLLTSSGLIASLSPERTLGWAGAALVAVFGVWGIMVRWRGRAPDTLGLGRATLDPGLLLFGLGLGVLAVAVAVALGTLGGLRLGSGPAVSQPTLWRYVVGLLAFFLSSILQDVLLLSGMVANLDARWPRPIAIALPAIIFAGLHLGVSHATVFAVLTDISFAVVLASLFFWASPQRSLAAPVGLHTAWNILISIVLGLPLTGEASTWALVRHEGGDQLWAGGEYGLEGGLAGLFAILLTIAVTMILRARRGAIA